MGGKGSGGYRKNALPRDKNPAVQAKYPDPDANHRSIQMGRIMMKWPKFTAYDNPDAVTDRFNDYLQLCDEYKFKPMVAGMAMALDMNRQTLSDIVHGRIKKWKNLTPESLVILQKCYDFLNMNLENNLIDEKGNPVKWIFLAKNHFNYRDQSERVVTNIDIKPELPTNDSVVKKYAGMVGKEKPQLEAEIIDVKDADEKDGD